MHVISRAIALSVPPICEKIGVSDNANVRRGFPHEARDAVNIERSKEICINSLLKPLFIIFKKQVTTHLNLNQNHKSRSTRADS